MAIAKLYGKLILSLFSKKIDWDNDTIKVMLCTSSYAVDQDTHQYKNSVTDEVIGEGYTAGGATLANKTITYTAGNNTCSIDADDTIWSASTLTARYAVIYADTGVDSTSPLIGYLDFEVDKSSDAGEFEITWDNSGISGFSVG
jgi:hypothetical protein